MTRNRAILLITLTLKELGLGTTPDYDVYEDPKITDGEKVLDIIEQVIGMKKDWDEDNIL